MDELLSGFIEEAEDLLESLDRAALALEENPGDIEAIRELFRSAHTLKGSAGLVGAREVGEVAHLLEESLEEVLSGERPFSGELADLLFKGFDYIRELVALLASGAAVDPARHQEMVAELGALQDGASAAQRALSRGDSGYADSLLSELPPEAREEILKAFEEEGASVYQVVLRFDPEIFFTGQDPLVIVREVLSAGEPVFFICHSEGLPPLEEIDPERVWVWFELYLKAPPGLLPRLEDAVEFLDPDTNTVVVRELRREELAPASPPERKPCCDPAVLKEILRQQEVYIEQNRGRSAAAPSLERVLSLTARALGESLELPGEPDPEWRCYSRAVEKLKGSLAELEGEAPASERRGEGAGGGQQAAEAGGKRYIRIEEGQLERLFELSGELAVAKNSIPYLVRRLEVYWGVPEAARELKEKYQLFEQISRELQDIVMGLRLIPVSQIFQRFPRFVRDVSRELGKRVRLAIEGEETRVDKAVLERVYEPLLHIVRNSLDHGVEPPEERAAKGKPAEGTIWMRAGQDGHTVFIEVEDDGRGIDPEKVRDAAVAKGVIAAEKALQLSDDEAVQLVFEAGFSTKGEVSELSGRGVGMDVVRDVVEGLGGRVWLKNRPGAGLAVRMELPLTVATTRVLVVRCSDLRLGIPMEDVQEVVKVEADRLQRIGAGEGLSFRGRVIAVRRLKEILGVGSPVSDEACCVIILRAGVGIAVDALEREAEILLKPLPGDMENIELYTGASILSDGSILLVLNPRILAVGGVGR
ncbi:MAG: chemotaxis protein CheA [Thermacetogeniaceae bacterium]